VVVSGMDGKDVMTSGSRATIGGRVVDANIVNRTMFLPFKFASSRACHTVQQPCGKEMRGPSRCGRGHGHGGCSCQKHAAATARYGRTHTKQLSV
jgi:hypothetical protein